MYENVNNRVQLRIARNNVRIVLIGLKNHSHLARESFSSGVRTILIWRGGRRAPGGGRGIPITYVGLSNKRMFDTHVVRVCNKVSAH